MFNCEQTISINPIHDLFKMVVSYLLTYFWLVWMGLIGHLSRRTFESTNCHGSWWDPGMVRWATRNKHFYFHGGTIELVESHQVGSTTTVVFVGHQHHTTTYTTGIYVYVGPLNYHTYMFMLQSQIIQPGLWASHCDNKHMVPTVNFYPCPYLFHAFNSTSKKIISASL